MILDVHPGSGFYPDPGVKKHQIPDSQHCTASINQPYVSRNNPESLEKIQRKTVQ
jgi:hypothetical protein